MNAHQFFTAFHPVLAGMLFGIAIARMVVIRHERLHGPCPKCPQRKTYDTIGVVFWLSAGLAVLLDLRLGF
jgi:hypothetical protein